MDPVGFLRDAQMKRPLVTLWLLAIILTFACQGTVEAQSAPVAESNATVLATTMQNPVVAL
jgi:hypothetical protein